MATVESPAVSEANVASILHALEAIHDRASTNQLRRQALEFLETQKSDKSAATTGFILASNRQNDPLIRHFGLSLLQHALKHQSSALEPVELEQLRNCVTELSHNVDALDPPYIRNKVSLLFVDVAKRSWGLDWLDMDETLVHLWNGNLQHKELVLTVLETLSDDIIHQEDVTSSLRGGDLNRALVEICTPYQVFKEAFPNRESQGQLRAGTEGWITRTSCFLDECLRNFRTSPQAKPCVLSSLATMKSLLAWMIPHATISSQCVPTIMSSFMIQDDDVSLAAVEALNALYGRSNYDIADFKELIDPMYKQDHIMLLKKLYEWPIVDPTDLSVSKYSLSKKLSELVAYLSGFLEESQYQPPNDSDILGFFSFMINIFQSASLTVSIPIAHSFSRLFAIKKVHDFPELDNFVGEILDICTTRLVRYETLPSESEDPTILFLNEDVDTMPERHAFVGNYRRYCSMVIELIVRERPHQAVHHIFSRVGLALNNLYENEEPFSPASFKKYSIPIIRAESQFAVVDATLKGFTKWVNSLGQSPQEDEDQRVNLENYLEEWAMNLMQHPFEDPIMKQRVLRLSVDFSAKCLPHRPSFALNVLHYILETIYMTISDNRPEFPLFSESIRELNTLATYEVRRLAIRYADHFTAFYDALEKKIQRISEAQEAHDRPWSDLSSILLITMQRSKTVDSSTREIRLMSMTQPIRDAWSDPSFRSMASSFQGFCEMLGLEKLWPYLHSRHVENFDDWSAIPLDDEGKNLQAEMNDKFMKVPLRMTKTMLAVSTDRIKPTEPAFQISCSLWKDMIPLILPTLLQLISHAHAFHNPESFPGLPQEMHLVVGRALTDRFWQAGISSGSRDEFYARIAVSRATLEGLSSSARGKVRAAREACYSILYSMSRLREFFYSFEELSVPLAQALFKDATSLSSHQFSVLLHVSRYLVEDCPPQCQPHFLPPMISTLFMQIDKKVTTEWELMEQRKAGMLDADLTDEMKDESVLRQLTYSAVMMIASLLDPQKVHNESIRTMVLSSPAMLEPVILFCTHALRMHDTRCCVIITHVIRSILEEFVPQSDTPTAAAIREFMSTEVLKACITSIHEPYFVDNQKDLAQLIASIWLLYGPSTETPRLVFMSLPGMTEAKVLSTEQALQRSTATRQQKALVLDLLEGLRGVSISEQGRISERFDRKKAKTAFEQRYMTVEMESQQERKADVDNGPDLTGVADMFS